MKVIFMGTPDFSVGTLEALIEAGHEVVLAVTQPDKPKGRGGKMQYTPVKEAALAHGIPVFQPVKIALGQQGVGNRQEGFHHPRELQERFVQIQRDEGVKPLPHQRNVEGIRILQWRVDEQSSKHANQHRVASHVLLEENGREIGLLVQTRDEKGAF